MSCADGGTEGQLMAAYFRKRKWPSVRVPLAIQSVVLDPLQRLRLVSGTYQPRLSATAALEPPAETLQFALARIAAIQIRELQVAVGCRRKSKCVFANMASAFICYDCFRFSATQRAAFTPRVANAGEESCGAAIKALADLHCRRRENERRRRSRHLSAQHPILATADLKVR